MLIGLNGQKGAGKNTVADFLIDKYGFEELSFAAKLKQSAASLWDLEPLIWEYLKNDPKANVDLTISGKIRARVTVREFLQRYGTESHRDIFGRDFWVDHATKGLNPNNGNYVFTDARFENEIDKIHSLGGYVARIIRGDQDESDTHASEIPPPAEKVDYTIFNDGTLFDLEMQSEEFYEWLLNEERDFGGTYED